MAREGLIVRDRAVEAALEGERSPASPRTLQRRVLRSTGMTQTTLRQIERARHAAYLLRTGVPAAVVAQDAGYFDQAHLTRSLARLVGLTPAKVAGAGEQLSFLYNTTLPDDA
jgi:methylphosphotriester-DNA--protein-cysteine methyltransferase